MTPAEYEAHVRAWKTRDRRIAARFAVLAVVTSRSNGGKLSMDDLMDDGEEENAE